MATSWGVRLFRIAAAVVTSVGLLAGFALAAQSPQVIRHVPGMKLSSLAKQQDSDIIQLKNGKRISVGALRSLDREAVRVRNAVPGSKRSPLLKFKPQENNIKGKIASLSDYQTALKRENHETWRLPSGRLVTSGQLKFIQPHADKLLNTGPLKQQQRPNLSGQAVAVTSSTDWKAVAKMPDNTVLEMQGSRKRVTVGELKQELTKLKQSGQLPSLGIRPESGTVRGGVK